MVCIDHVAVNFNGFLWEVCFVFDQKVNGGIVALLDIFQKVMDGNFHMWVSDFFRVFRKGFEIV
jgi:hypothetical protein